MNSTVINLFVSFAPLLPGNPTDCIHPIDVKDKSCSGGLVSVASAIRHSQQRGDGPAVHIPQLERTSKFVNMHPLGLGVNLVSHERFGWNAYFARPSLFTSDQDGVSTLQTQGFGPFLTNLDIPPMSSWFQYHQNIHFDHETSTAYVHIHSESQPLAAPAVESLIAALDYVADLNENSGCFNTSIPSNDRFDEEVEGGRLNSRCVVFTSRCWSPIVFMAVHEQYEECLEVSLNHPHPPLVFYDDEEKSSSAIIMNNTLVFHPSDSTDILSHLHIEVGQYDASKKRSITHMAYSEIDLPNLPFEFKDDVYIEDQKYIRDLAEQAIVNDPEVGMSGYMPFTRDGDWRMCMGGECPIGNLFTDALRWAGDADFAVVASGGLRGPGWEEGPVHVSDIWIASPFVNFLCTGVMNGVSVYQLLNYSTAVSTFESTYTPMGDRLLQMSGMRITYNTLLSGMGSGRLMSVDIWDKAAQEYLPLDRLKLYRFATDSWLCGGFHPYPSLFGDELKRDGEVPGVVDQNRDVQTVVIGFLESLNDAYDTSIQGRLINDTEAFEPLDFTQVQESGRSDDSKVLLAGILASLLGGLLVAFLILLRKNKRTRQLLKQKEKELDAFHLGTSKFGDAVAFIDSLLESDSPHLGPNDVDKLILVKRCLITGSDDNTMHVPNNLRGSRDMFILKEFAGVGVQRGLDKQAGVSMWNFNSLTEFPTHEVKNTVDCLKEFTSLDVGKQKILFDLLSFSNLQQWDFNIFNIAAIDEENALLLVAWAILASPHSQFAMATELQKKNLKLDDFEGYDFLDMDLDVDMGILCDYLRVIQRNYNDNPYHNAIHAADVVQTTHSMIQMAGENLFEKQEIFTIIVVAVIHDVNHPGLNNSFQVNSFSNLALAHNDAAVLENEHASHAFKLLVKGLPGEFDNLNFLRQLDISVFGAVRQKMVSAILHTDMSTHFSTVAKMKNLAAGKTWDEIDSKLRWEILELILHLADISNPAKNDPMFKLWTDRCLDEFFAQGDKERERGLPISPNCNRHETKKPDSQIGFINFVVKPAFEVLGAIIPSVGRNILPVIQNNLMYWEDQKANEETA